MPADQESSQDRVERRSCPVAADQPEMAAQGLGGLGFQAAGDQFGQTRIRGVRTSAVFASMLVLGRLAVRGDLGLPHLAELRARRLAAPFSPRE